jgi:four helix bundle protein
MKTYRELNAWKEAMNLVEMIYTITKNFPKEERYGLTSQIQRAAVSIPSNIAEGYGRSHRKEYLNHLSISKGSLLELETQLLIAFRLTLITREELKPVWHQLQIVGKLISFLQKSLQVQK